MGRGMFCFEVMGRFEHMEKLKLCVYPRRESFFSDVERDGMNADFHSVPYWYQVLFYLETLAIVRMVPRWDEI